MSIELMISVGTKNESTREKWIENILKNISANSRILDAGAGELKHKIYCKHLKYVSQDFAQYDGSGNNKGLQTEVWDTSRIDIVSDIIDIPEPNQSFDAIMCTEVFEHLSNPILAVKEFCRLLKPKGKLILTAPFCSLTHFAPYHFASGFNEYWYKRILKENGFHILEIQKNGNYFEYLAQELRRLDSVIKKYAEDSLSEQEVTALIYLLRRLEEYSKKDSGSNELLYFGCHVFAEKI